MAITDTDAEMITNDPQIIREVMTINCNLIAIHGKSYIVAVDVDRGGSKHNKMLWSIVDRGGRPIFGACVGLTTNGN